MGPIEPVTLAIALIGVGLGLFNTYRAVAKDRIRLRVTPKRYVVPGGNLRGLSIEVTNLSAVALTLEEIGLRSNGRDDRVIPQFIPTKQYGGCPHKLEPRTSVTVICVAGADKHPSIAKVDHAYARTACGITATGNSAALRQMINKARGASGADEPGSNGAE